MTGTFVPSAGARHTRAIRRLGVIAALVSALGVAACEPTPPAPTPPPTVENVLQTPAVVSAGGQFVVTADITSSGTVTGAHLANFTGVSVGPTTVPYVDISPFLGCGPAELHIVGGITSVSITCTVAPDAPNGTWNYNLVFRQEFHLDGSVEPGGLTVVGG